MTKRCCGTCAYVTRPKGHWIELILWRWPGLLFCCNRADAPGDMHEVFAHGVCRNHRPRRARTERPNGRQPEDPAVRRIPLTKGKFATVDAADYAWLSRHRWFAIKRGRTWYACRREGRRTILMHREIMKAPKGRVVDHYDGNGLNNRRDNLRLCSARQNAYNVRRPSPDSQYVGVLRCGLLWAARLFHDGREHWLGVYDTEIEAAVARDAKATELQGSHAYLNFPHGPPPGVPRPRGSARRVLLSGTITARSAATARLSVTRRTAQRKP